MESITIHHSKLRLSTVVPRSTADVLAPKGWKPGALPKKRGTKAATKEAQS